MRRKFCCASIFLCALAMILAIVLLIKNRSTPPPVPVKTISDLLLLDHKKNNPDYVDEISPHSYRLIKHYRLSEDEKKQSIQILKEKIEEAENIKLDCWLVSMGEEWYEAEISEIQHLKSGLVDSLDKCGHLEITPDGVYGANDSFVLTFFPSELKIYVLMLRQKAVDKTIDHATVFMTYDFFGRRLEGQFNKEFIKTVFSCQTKDGQNVGQWFGYDLPAQQIPED